MKALLFGSVVGIALVVMTGAIAQVTQNGQVAPRPAPPPANFAPGVTGGTTNFAPGVTDKPNFAPGVSTNLPPGVTTNLPPGVSNKPLGH